MAQATEDLEALGAQIAQGVKRQRDLEDSLNRYLASERHWFGGTFRLLWAVLPGALVIIASEMSYPVRAIVAIAVSLAFGLLVEHVRLQRRFNVVVQLLLLLSRRK
jgi:hypothetical protein